eukprot:1855947-Lingulodinium_polyedra.AAC.1
MRRVRTGGAPGGLRWQALPCALARAWRAGRRRPRLGCLGALTGRGRARGGPRCCGQAGRLLARSDPQARRP